MVDLSTEIAGIKLKNPVMTASGTFGYGEEFSRLIDLNRLGGIVVKGLSIEPMGESRIAAAGGNALGHAERGWLAERRGGANSYPAGCRCFVAIEPGFLPTSSDSPRRSMCGLWKC